MKTSMLETLTDFYADISLADLPEAVVAKTRRSLFDFLGVLLAGHRQGVLSPIALAYVRAQQAKEEASLLPLPEKSSAALAAFYTGVAAHAVELDDGHRFGTSHPAVAVIPAVLAVAERQDRSFAEVILGVAVGYDMMLRVARAVNPSHLKRGFHTTGTAGSIGAAAGAGKVLALNQTQLTHCVAMGGLQSAGLQEMLHSNPSIKPLQAGKAAQAGVLSADLAALGAAGPVSLFEGPHGWFKAMADTVNPDLLLGELGARWEICNTYTKLYPTCRHCHHAVDLAIDFHREGIDPDAIRRIQVDTYNVAIGEVGGVAQPENLEEAMFSLPYAVALALIYGKVRLKELESQLTDARTKALAARVDIREDAAMNAVYPDERGSRMTIECSGGAVFTRETKLPRGEFDTPINDDQYIQKAYEISEDVVSKGCIKDLWKIIVEGPIEKTTVASLKDAVQYCERNQYAID